MSDESFIGQRFRVDVKDCCVHVEFEAALSQVVQSAWGDKTYVFDNGVTVDGGFDPATAERAGSA